MKKHKYYLGKVDGYGNGQKNCEAYITWELMNGEFSMCAEVWNHQKTDILEGGQCVDRVAGYCPGDKRAARMVEVWERWHLNDMRSGCVHQRAAGWDDGRINPADLPDSTANKDERGILAVWVHPSEHKNGVLGKPCPECGYKYGSKWLREELPAEVVAEIENWSNTAPTAV